MDYNGAMGVPITFLDKYKPEQFKILDGIGRYSIAEIYQQKKLQGTYLTKINGNPRICRNMLETLI